MENKSLTSDEIKEKFLQDLKDGLDRIEDRDAWKATDPCSEREDYDKSEIIWEYANSVLFVFPEGDEIFASFIQFLRYCSDLVWMTPSVILYEGRLAVRVTLVDTYTPGRPTRN